MGYILRAIDETETIKISAAITTDVVEEATKIHKLSKTTSAALGRVLTAASIIGSWQKNEEDSITLSINGDGPAGRIVATCKNDGFVKGYVTNPTADLPIRESDGKIDVSGIVGKGNLTLVMDTGMKKPYTGTVNLTTGEIAEDLAVYFSQSDQVPSAVGLGVLVDVDYSIKAAGGFIIQLMPDATEEQISKLEENLKNLPSVTSILDEYHDAEKLIEIIMKDMNFKILEKREITYKCNCSREKVEDAIVSVGPKEIEEILREDKKAEVSCYFCDKVYNFDESDLERMLKKAKDINKNRKIIIQDNF
ncbi:MAG: Hsp33 family molecular chaperone HslO [Peptoniphilaceae bacterium]|uniref:Hsp33 family molecular chaperone HslO n=1 Tax=Peptoniphilus sp. TaxID=1971214 RepID=UPI0029773A0A|nr:Hsp33 family molecular chaperone HslO [Peptoniphilus sp.]MDD7353146.1 Hsp33 family molecular chaperone HslO [Peptoniphilaceae bacterium]MDY3903045.1 Hsp33 family molecular chaperone HslO [Peptoniphilus sp.]